MKIFAFLLGLGIALAAPQARAKEYVLLDTDKASQDWRITSEELGLKVDKPFSVSVRNLHGGRQEGVCIVEIDNGVMKISVVPTRGMNGLEAVVGKIRLGWDFSGASNLDELNRRLRSGLMLRRLKKEVLPQLPPLMRSLV